MRAFEIITESRSEPITLRQLNRLKHQAKRRQKLDDERAQLISVMYRDHQHDQEQLEFERAQMELAQLRAEISQTQAETRKLDRDAGLKSQQRITAMAQSAMRKRKA
ncbi:MAG: hypothetical protein NXI19_04150 [Alphaproteobacteria bacterium]|jgi:multidrug efflux pump subunit AcrA (membrane-fusion protein)|nr:hypothetical protein [Alphaproteobacteria bacterium]